MNVICKKIEIPKKDPSIKLKKISDEDLVIPTTETINVLNQFNYNGKQLKFFAKHYKLKQSGNKNEIFSRIYNYLFLSGRIICIQSMFRGNIWRKYLRCHGPAYKKRELCINDTDFLTMEPLNEIPLNQFFSYKDKDDFVYGFDSISLFNLNKKIFYHRETRNPYNRNPIPKNTILRLKRMIRLSKVLKCPIDIEIKDESTPASEKDFQTRC